MLFFLPQFQPKYGIQQKVGTMIIPLFLWQPESEKLPRFILPPSTMTMTTTTATTTTMMKATTKATIMTKRLKTTTMTMKATTTTVATVATVTTRARWCSFTALAFWFRGGDISVDKWTSVKPRMGQP